MKLIFTLTAGRTGTAYLAELIKWNVKDAEVHHEILTFSSFGVDTPDISHLHAFNNAGNTPLVQEFWKRKLNKILACGKPVYVETSPMLMKAGLVENMAELAHEHEVHFVVLRRNTLKTLESYNKRGDFTTQANMWMHYLDPEYSRNKVRFENLFHIVGQASLLRLWYLNEIEMRITQYLFNYSDRPFMHFHFADIDDLNDKQNATKLFNGLEVEYANICLPPKQNSYIDAASAGDKGDGWIKEAIKTLGLYRS